MEWKGDLTNKMPEETSGSGRWFYGGNAGYMVEKTMNRYGKKVWTYWAYLPPVDTNRRLIATFKTWEDAKRVVEDHANTESNNG